MFVDPQKARREEQERQLKIRAEQERQKKLRLEEEKRKAKIREEEKRKARLRADAKAKESEPSKTEPKSKQPQTQLHHQFKVNVAAKAQGLLKANKDRLNAEQTQYFQDNNPKSDRWSHLWQMAAQRREFQAQHANLRQQLEFTTQEIHNLSDIPDGMGLMATPEERQNSSKHKRLLALSEQKKRLRERIAVAKQMQVSLEYLYPALSAVKNETGTNPEDIKRVQRRLPEEFDGIRGNINKLSAEVTKDPSTALLFDSVVTSELLKEGHNQAQRKDLTSWLEDERGNKERLSQLGQAVGGGLFLASFIPQLRGGASLLQILGAGTVGATFAYDLPDLMLLNAAAQSGRGGAGQLTSQSLEEARFNLVMGYANVALAGLDVGAEVRVIRGLERLVGQGSVQGAQVLRQTWVQVMSLARQGDAGLVKARELLMKAKGVPQSMVDEVMEVLSPMEEMVGVGKLSRSEMRGNTAGQMTTEEALKTAKAGGTTVRKSNPNVSPEILAKWSKTKNWNEVEPFIGQQAGADLPPGYEYAEYKNYSLMRRKKGLADDDKVVPLQIGEDATFQVTTKTTNRISKPKVMDRNFEAAYGKRKDGYWIHHLIPDDVMRKNALAKFARMIGYDLDDSANLIGLANKEQWAKIQKGGVEAPGEGYTNAVGHWSSHDKYSKQVSVYLNRRLEKLKGDFGDLEQALKNPKTKKQLIQEVDQAMVDAENEFRSLIEQGQVLKKDGRISWNNEQTEPTA